MKYISDIITISLITTLLFSCKDEENPVVDIPIEKEKPQIEEQPEEPLKTVIDHEKHPNFLLACGVSVDDFLDPNNKFSTIVPENYDEMTADNAMKYASCVSWDGTMNFTKVKQFVAGAKAKNMKIYGHTLAWHSQQQVNYLKNIVDKAETPEKQKEALINELDRWIGGMMEATGGFVTSWDAVNEPLGGADNDNDGKYDLQDYDNSAEHNYNTETSNFFWQHFIGDEDYIPTVINLARKHFKENGGDPNKLKLFVNDYNLESFWDGNGKAKSLLEWINVWEAKGCIVDGIGTQMHISCYENDDFENTSRKHITEMFKILAQSGKLIRISELDMGYNASMDNIWANGLKYSLLSNEQKEKMADKYEWLYKEYFRLIPVEQQYGICQWSITDAPDVDYMWRRGEPIGLWTINFMKKPAYYGTLRGLKE